MQKTLKLKKHLQLELCLYLPCRCLLITLLLFDVFHEFFIYFAERVVGGKL